MFTVKSYDKMKSDFSRKVSEVLLRNHGVSEVKDLPETPQPRRQQVQFLYQIITQLDEYKPEKTDNLDQIKAKILTGCLYTISDIIKHSYDTSVLNRFYPILTPGGSDLYIILQEVMGINAKNPLDLKTSADQITLRSIMQEAEKFLGHQLYIECNFSKDIKLDHPFVQIVYPASPHVGFNLAEFVDCVLVLRETAARDNWRDKLLADATQQQERCAKEHPSESKSLLFSMFSKVPAQGSTEPAMTSSNAMPGLSKADGPPSTTSKVEYPPLQSTASMTLRS